MPFSWPIQSQEFRGQGGGSSYITWLVAGWSGIQAQHIWSFCYSKSAMPYNWFLSSSLWIFWSPGLYQGRHFWLYFLCSKNLIRNVFLIQDLRSLKSQENLDKSPHLRKPGWTPMTFSTLTISLTADTVQEVCVSGRWGGRFKYWSVTRNVLLLLLHVCTRPIFFFF